MEAGIYQANQRDAELRGESRGDERRATESALSMYSDGLAVEKIAIKKWVGEDCTYFTQQH